MEIKEILNKLNEDLNEDIARKNLEANDYDIENIEKRELRTMYDTYTYYGDVSCGVIKAEDFKKFITDTCNEFAQQLPDKFDRYFDVEALEKDVWEWPVCLRQAQDFIDERGEHVDIIEKWIPVDDDCYVIEIY